MSDPLAGAQPGRTLLIEAESLIEAAHRAFTGGAEPDAIRLSFDAFMCMARACLDRDGRTAVGPADAVEPGAVMHEYLEAFGRGGRLYAAYYRWMCDVSDYARAVEIGQSIADDRCARTSVDRARMFWDAVDRFLEKTR